MDTSRVSFFTAIVLILQKSYAIINTISTIYSTLYTDTSTFTYDGARMAEKTGIRTILPLVSMVKERSSKIFLS